MKKSQLRKLIKEEITSVLNEDRNQMKEFMGEMLGDFLQFVVTLEDELEVKYDNPGDLMILKERKEAMLDAMDNYVEFLVEIDEKTDI
tara:strand:- start:769 stop:1032 length:264 start_codon:yes stop_codon:yes gene_type:complete